MMFQKFSESTLKDSLEYTQLPQTHIEMNKKGDQYENQDNILLQLHQDKQQENQLMDFMEFPCSLFKADGILISGSEGNQLQLK